MPIPPNALPLDPPPIINHIRTQILSGADIVLFTLLSPLSVTLKNSAHNPLRILSFAKFIIPFTGYSEIICTVFPHRKRKVSDYLSLVPELSLLFGGSHFYTYYKLFSAKSAIHITQRNQCPYWGTLDTDLHNCIILGCATNSIFYVRLTFS